MVNLSADDRPIYVIDAFDRVVSWNAAWSEFVRADGRSSRADEELFHRPVWTVLDGGQVRQLWEVLFDRVRAVGAPLFVAMRADTADRRRLVDIELRPTADRSIVHIFEPVWSEARPAVALLDPAYPRDERKLRLCSWCKRVQVRMGVWEEIEAAQLLMGIEAAETLPSLCAASCTSCKQSVLQSFPARVA